jgi:DNA polymerase III epsilon subunit-like protein
MEKIQESAKNFLRLVNSTKYVFHVARRNVNIITLDFSLKDFHHILGLQYLTDINIPRNKNKTIEWILDDEQPITDAYLAESKFYKGKDYDEKDIEKRISELSRLEQYLDEENFIRIFTPDNISQNNSLMACDYIIESQLKGSPTTVYIFLKHRNGEDSPCCVVSFCVKKNVSYGGKNLYWMLKEKIVDGNKITLYRHPKYRDFQKDCN